MSDIDDSFDMFQEPTDYYQEEKKPTFVEHGLADGRRLSLRLVGHNPLWVCRNTNVASSSAVFLLCSGLAVGTSSWNFVLDLIFHDDC